MFEIVGKALWNSITNREIASLIIASLLFILVVIYLRFSHEDKGVWSALKDLISSALVFPIIMPVITALIYCSVSTYLAWKINLWDISMLKDSILLSFGVAIPLMYKSLNFREGNQVIHTILKGAIGLETIAIIYLNLVVFSLPLEILVQTIATAIVFIQFAYNHQNRHICNPDHTGTISTIFGMILIFVETYYIFTTNIMWLDLAKSVTYSIWIPATFAPFMYIVAYHSHLTRILSMYKIERKIKPSLTVVMVILFGTRGQLSVISQLAAPQIDFTDISTWREYFTRMSGYRHSALKKWQKERTKKNNLRRNAGRPGVDSTGAHLDRREFYETKSFLDALWLWQNAMFDNWNNSYSNDSQQLAAVRSINGSSIKDGLIVEISADKKSWRAWKKLPGGAVLGVAGADGNNQQYYFQGDVQPEGWPGLSEEWINSEFHEKPADWQKYDGSYVL